MLILVMAQPVAAQSIDAGVDAAKRGDYATALKHLRPLAEQGHAEAQYWLGWMYFNGQGVRRDPKEAVRWFRKAAEQGQIRAQRMLGYLEEQLRRASKYRN